MKNRREELRKIIAHAIRPKTMEEIIKQQANFGANHYDKFEITLLGGNGTSLRAIIKKDGKEKEITLKDFFGAYSATSVGNGHPRIIEAAYEQLTTGMTLSSGRFYNEWSGALAEILVKLFGFEGAKALMMNSGAEAVETAIKAMRQWGYIEKGIPKDKAEIIVFDGNFGGRTITIVSASPHPEYRDNFGPLTPGFKMVPYGDIEAVRKAITPNTCGILVEPIQGEGGIIVPYTGFLKDLQKLCAEENTILALDEIQVGLGRTGKLFCHQYEIIPDKRTLLILGKALGGGLIVSAVIGEIVKLFKPGSHGSTFGENPFNCRVAIEALSIIIDEDLPARAEKLGKYFMSELEKIKIKSPYIKEVRGKGLFIGVQLKPEAGPAIEFCKKLIDMGILCTDTHKTIIRFAPPPMITKEEIDWALVRIKQVLEN